MAKRPHIIILNPDEMRFDTMGHMGNRAAHTPNLDRLAVREAVSFDHAYCQNPVCVPSRCSFLTGLYPHTTGHRTMHYLMHEGESSLFSELKNAGYYVWVNGRNDFLAGQVNDLEKVHADEIFYYDKNEKVIPPDPKALAGLLQGGKTDAAGQKKAAGQTDAAGQREYSHYTGVQEGGRSSAAGDWKDTYAAIERIRRIDELGDQPLCLFLGWTNPHVPYVTEQKYYDLIRDEDIVMPADPKAAVGKSRMIHKLQEYAHLDQWTEEQWRQLRHVYLAQCAMVDDMVGHVIDALKEADIYDDCAIFFLSDHGDFTGDFHLTEKAQSSFEDILTRVPLLVKPPKWLPVDPGLASGVVELVDFYATAMAYAGVKPDHDQFGKDLSAVIGDRSVRVRTYAHCEGGRNAGEWQCDEYHTAPDSKEPNPSDDYYAKKMAQFDNAAHEKAVMITDGKWKLIYRSSGASELYHLEKDPLEMYNLLCPEADLCGEAAAEIGPQTLRLQTEALNWYQLTCDVVPRTLDSRFTEDKIWSMVRSMVPAELEAPMRSYIRAEHPDFFPAIQHAIGLAMAMTSHTPE